MHDRDILLSNLDKLHTTEMGINRIRRNLSLDSINVVQWCLNMIQNKDSIITKKGKNFYIEFEDSILTVNASSYTIITSHKIKKNAL